MEHLKPLLKKLLFLPPLPTVLIAVPSFLLVFWMLATEHHSVFTCPAYLLSAYAMLITVTGFSGLLQAVRTGFDQLPLVRRIRQTPFGDRLLRDDLFRMNLGLHGGLLMNLLYVALNLFSGIRYRSTWFVALAAYYLLLSAMWASLAQYVRRQPIGQNIPAELRRYRLCGIFLVLMNQALIGIVAAIVNRNNGFVYPGMLIYAMAAYTFYITILAFYHLFKYRKRGSPILSAAKTINLTAALVSMLSLETAMLNQFGSDQPDFRRTMTAASGGAVCAIVLGMAVYMIVRSTKALNAKPPLRRHAE